jgi:DDE superfamily endonuclease
MGVQDDFPTVKYVLPLFRKKRKSELSDEEKKHNRKHSKLRVIAEHTVSRIKKFGIMVLNLETSLEDMIMLLT